MMVPFPARVRALARVCQFPGDFRREPLSGLSFDFATKRLADTNAPTGSGLVYCPLRRAINQDHRAESLNVFSPITASVHLIGGARQFNAQRTGHAGRQRRVEAKGKA
jgi:hypothetical protein